MLAGYGYGDGCKHVPQLLKRYQPDCVFVQDCRDWMQDSGGAFNKDVYFTGYEALADWPGRVFTVLKDAWQCHERQGGFAKAIGADAIVTYYRHDMIRDVAPWTIGTPLLRMHHSVDAELIRSILTLPSDRKRGIVTGNVAHCYPLRKIARKNASQLGIDVRQHPGYHNKGSDTPAYLRQICGYKVHVACSSQWGAAFRKIIESVACGCTPVTDLPTGDVLPEIDGALVRVPQGAGFRQLRDVIDMAESQWNFDERMSWAVKALEYYDWKASGIRLARMLESCTKLQTADNSDSSVSSVATNAA